MRWVVVAVAALGLLVVACDTEAAPSYSVDQYRHSHAFCTEYRSDVHAQSGTSDHVAAARWYAETYTPGPARDGATEGCLDGLRGSRNKHPAS